MRNLKLLGLMLLTFCSSALLAQPDMQEREEKVEKLKIAFITERLDLTVEEAQKFWPVYNQFSNEMKELRKGRKPDKDMDTKLMNMSDSDVEKMIEAEMAARQKEVDLMRKYYAQFKQVLPIKKVAMLYKLEREFHRELLERIKNRPEGGRPHRPRD